MNLNFNNLNFLDNSNKNFKYICLLIIHIIIGVLIYKFPFTSKIYGFLIFIFGLYFILKNKNRNNEVLYVASYVVGSEVLLRATNGCISYEFAKYSITFFMILGIFYSGFSKKAYLYILFLLLLIPSILISIDDCTIDFKKKLFFDILGPICLGFCSIYCYNKKVSKLEVNSILLNVGLPIVTLCSYLFFKSPISFIKERYTESNYELSGFFGPNQVATILGLGMFIFFSRVFLIPSSKKIIFLNILLSSYMFYRGLLTFSRGGVITGLAMIIVFLFFISFYKTKLELSNLKYPLILFCTSFLLVTIITNNQTYGLLLKRYANKNVSGTENYNAKTGREAIAIREIKIFAKKPIFGIGVGNAKETSKKDLGEKVSSHSEVTRMLSEHGTLGIIDILILIVVPALLFLETKHNIYLITFLVFWVLTINHSTMRIAAPSFIYALALLNIKFDKPEIINSI